ncbi:MAG: glycosyltransferase family 2 protein [Candidatus Sericytochromatia bacterium]
MPAEPLLVLSEAPSPLLLSTLNALLQQDPAQPLQVWCQHTQPAEAEAWSLGVRLRLCQQHHQRGGYATLAALPLELVSRSDLSASDFQAIQAQGLLIIPQSASRDEEALDIQLSEQQLHWLETAQSVGLELDETRLEQALQQALAEALAPYEAAAAVADLSTRLRTLTQEASSPERDEQGFWEQSAADYAYLFDLQLWREDAAVHLRPQLEHLIAAYFARPSWALALLLLLFKRTPSSLPPHASPLSAVYSLFRQRLQATVSLLPPTQDFKVTLMVLTFNRLHTLKRTLDSILSQTYPHWELIIVDGGSQDETPDYCRQLSARDARIRYIYADLPRGLEGIRASTRLLIESMQTELGVLCPDDDWFAPDYLEKSVAQFRRTPWAAMVFGSYTHHDAQGVYAGAGFGPLYPQPGVIHARLDLQREAVLGLCPQGCLYRKEILQGKVMELMFHPPERPTYLGWDYIIGVHLMGHYEVGYVPEAIFRITVDDTTAVSGKLDSSSGLLFALEEILSVHQAIFERPYPDILFALFHNRIIRHHLNSQFERLIGGDRAEFEAKLPEKERIWRHYLDLKDMAAKTCSPSALPLFKLG